jgi:hypothetical protein
MASPDPRHTNPDPSIDPEHLFTFLAKHDEYPASGQHLAAEAREAGAGSDVVEFFEGVPITLGSESEVVEHAIKPDELPYGKTLDLSNGSEDFTQDEATLELSDIKPDPSSGTHQINTQA